MEKLNYGFNVVEKAAEFLLLMDGEVVIYVQMLSDVVQCLSNSGFISNILIKAAFYTY